MKTRLVLYAFGAHITLEGPNVEGVVIAEFPSTEDRGLIVEGT
jgi:hypothetical protein